MKTTKKIITAIVISIAVSAFFFTACKTSKKTEKPSADVATEDKVEGVKEEKNAEVEPEANTEANSETKPEAKSDSKSSADSKKSKPLTVIIKNLETDKAPVHVTFYQEKHKFLSLTDVLNDYVFTSHGKVLTQQITDLKFGDYAIAAYQDVNSDKKCNRNLIGIPNEPYAFSNNFKPTIRAPRFDECKFTYSAKSNSITIDMINK